MDPPSDSDSAGATAPTEKACEAAEVKTEAETNHPAEDDKETPDDKEDVGEALEGACAADYPPDSLTSPISLLRQASIHMQVYCI